MTKNEVYFVLKPVSNSKKWVIEVYKLNDELKGIVVAGNKPELFECLDTSIEEDDTIDINPGEN